MLGVSPASISSITHGLPVPFASSAGSTASPSHAFSPTTTGNSESSTRL